MQHHCPAASSQLGLESPVASHGGEVPDCYSGNNPYCLGNRHAIPLLSGKSTRYPLAVWVIDTPPPCCRSNRHASSGRQFREAGHDRSPTVRRHRSSYLYKSTNSVKSWASFGPTWNPFRWTTIRGFEPILDDAQLSES